jgi:ketosteroid isomerase-like protein
MTMARTLAMATLFVATMSAGAAHGPQTAVSLPEEAEQVADALHNALARGDAAAVLGLLAPDVLIFESGGAESSAAEYASHHLPADIAFLREMRHTRIARKSGGDTESAWVATRSRMQGRYDGKDIDVDSTETLLLTHRNDHWQIVHIHWSSAPHRAAP